MSYPLIKKYMPELQIVNNVNFSDVVNASELEAELAKGIVLNGCIKRKQKTWLDVDNWAFDSHYTDSTTTHACLAIGLQKIEDTTPVSKDELVSLLKKELEKDYLSGSTELKELIERINKYGVK